MFIDIAKVTVQAGKGGDGAVSFRHEIYVDKGGPDGGDGGRGGDVIFLASEQLNTLLKFRYQPRLIASDGVNGSKRKMAGRSGEDLVVKVPVGTVVKRDGAVIADLVSPEQKVVVAKGGDGGFGNAHFKSSTRQTPRMAELGEPGESFEAELELKLLADVGLIGFPNAGKSTFLSVVSNARPEIANYEFTTLTPNLGVADVDDGSILIADIPGLIEGASEGRGLGDQFLRHVERTAVLLHMIDAYSDNPAEKYLAIRRELEKYSKDLAERPEIVALTKCEGLDDEIIAMQATALQNVTGGAQVVAISSQTHHNIKELLRLLRQEVEDYRQREAKVVETSGDDVPVISLGEGESADNWLVERLDDVENEDGEVVRAFKVTGKKIEKFARRTNFDQFEAVNRLRDIMKRLGISHELMRRGAEGDSYVVIGESQLFTLVEQ
ncbi:GTPase ObgE [Candidatus Saccharibacteria bacterium oral taxon 955]|nr:GTPase ObgE [Candidatus Saccharibacteria bacterium oral taxon 955]QJU06047.1 GTPase ObgE [Candidatus Saccharibacteria bacterium oral taxon 955]